MAKKKKVSYARCGMAWKTMKLGKYKYPGTYTGAKSNVCRANRMYPAKRWVTYSTDDGTFIERIA